MDGAELPSPGPKAAARLRAVWLGGALVLVLSAHASSLSGPFLWDDLSLLESISRLPAGGRGFVRLFAQPFFDWWGCYYRPLTALSFLAGVRFFGVDPVSFHVVNLLGHLVNVVLLYRLVRRVASPRVAALAAGLWGVLPRLTESVTWISGRTDVFAATAVFAALLLWEDRLIRRWAAALCLLLGLFFKEVAIAAVPVLVLRDLVHVPKGGRRAAAGRLLPVAVALGFYAAIRSRVLVAQFFVDVIGRLDRIRLAFECLGTYAASAIDLFRPRLFIGNKFERRPELAVAGVVVLIAFVTMVVRAVRARREGVAEGLTLAGAALVPVLHLVPLPMTARAADRCLYIPLAGLALAVAASSTTWSRTSRRVVGAFALILAPCLGLATSERNRIYTDEIDFWLEAVRTAPPGHVVPQLYFADLLQRNGRVREGALLHWRLASDPRTASAIPGRLAFADKIRLSASLARAGEDEEAIRLLRSLAAEDPASPLVRQNLVLLYLRRPDVVAARAEARGLADLVGPERSRDVFRLVEDVERELARPRDEGGGTDDERRRRARLLGRLGGPRARNSWLAETERKDATSETLREAVAWLVVEGSLEEASRSYERLKLQAPDDPLTARLGAVLADRRERERKLDAAIVELNLGGSGPR